MPVTDWTLDEVVVYALTESHLETETLDELIADYALVKGLKIFDELPYALSQSHLVTEVLDELIADYALAKYHPISEVLDEVSIYALAKGLKAFDEVIGDYALAKGLKAFDEVIGDYALTESHSIFEVLDEVSIYALTESHSIFDVLDEVGDYALVKGFKIFDLVGYDDLAELHLITFVLDPLLYVGPGGLHNNMPFLSDLLKPVRYR